MVKSTKKSILVHRGALINGYIYKEILNKPASFETICLLLVNQVVKLRIMKNSRKKCAMTHSFVIGTRISYGQF